MQDLDVQDYSRRRSGLLCARPRQGGKGRGRGMHTTGWTRSRSRPGCRCCKNEQDSRCRSACSAPDHGKGKDAEGNGIRRAGRGAGVPVVGVVEDGVEDRQEQAWFVLLTLQNPYFKTCPWMANSLDQPFASILFEKKCILQGIQYVS